MKKGLLVIISMLVIACGGSNGGSDSGDTAYSGKVLLNSGYTVTNVCFDGNGNKKCDDWETSAIRDGNTFMISGTAEDAKANLIAEITGAGPDKLVLEAVTGKNDVISSVTTMIKSRMDLQGESLDIAEKKVKKGLFGDENHATDLYSDSADVSAEADKIFNVIAEIFVNLRLDFSSELMTAIYQEVSTQLDKIKNDQGHTIVNNTNQTDINNKIDAIQKNIFLTLRQGVYVLEFDSEGSELDQVKVTRLKILGEQLFIDSLWVDEIKNGVHVYNKNININNIKYQQEFDFRFDGAVSSIEADDETGGFSMSIYSTGKPADTQIKNLFRKTAAGEDATGKTHSDGILDRTVHFSEDSIEYKLKYNAGGTNDFSVYSEAGMKQILKAYFQN